MLVHGFKISKWTIQLFLDKIGSANKMQLMFTIEVIVLFLLASLDDFQLQSISYDNPKVVI